MSSEPEIESVGHFPSTFVEGTTSVDDISRRPVRLALCAECGHFSTHHVEGADLDNDLGCLRPDCDCQLSRREAAFGRDDELDEEIRRALWEGAVAEGVYDEDEGDG